MKSSKWLIVTRFYRKEKIIYAHRKRKNLFCIDCIHFSIIQTIFIIFRSQNTNNRAFIAILYDSFSCHWCSSVLQMILVIFGTCSSTAKATIASTKEDNTLFLLPKTPLTILLNINFRKGPDPNFEFIRLYIFSNIEISSWNKT